MSYRAVTGSLCWVSQPTPAYLLQQSLDRWAVLVRRYKFAVSACLQLDSVGLQVVVFELQEVPMPEVQAELGLAESAVLGERSRVVLLLVEGSSSLLATAVELAASAECLSPVVVVEFSTVFFRRSSVPVVVGRELNLRPFAGDAVC